MPGDRLAPVVTSPRHHRDTNHVTRNRCHTGCRVFTRLAMGRNGMAKQRPHWAERIRSMRIAKGLSQAEAAEAMREHAPLRPDGTRTELPRSESITHRWKKWEAGENRPDDFYGPLIAAVLGTVTSALFPPELDKKSAELDLLSATGMNTLEIVSRLQASD